MSSAHPALPPPYAHSNYSGSSVKTEQSIQANGRAMQSQQMMPATVPGQEPNRFSGTNGNYRYTLVVEQQPIRARMCGFGDKDRRPITPPPCIRIIIEDITTGRELSADDVDAQYFLLSVDLWDENAQVEKNVVRASSNSPAVSISTATTTSFPPAMERPIYTSAQGMPMYPPTGYMMQPAAQGQYPPPGVYPQSQAMRPAYPGAPPQQYYQQPGYPPQYSGAPSPASPAYSQGYGQQPAPYAQQPQQSGSGMFTRNLIGSLTVNAFELVDPGEKKGHWFILQDLSVRTEGVFRLKMNFVDLGSHHDPTATGSNRLNQGKTPILASVFSQPFQVYSAKKFPGVIESTPLSKTFASQGIKIPIRKDGAKNENKDDDAED